MLWHHQRRWFQPRTFWRFRLRLNGGVQFSSKLRYRGGLAEDSGDCQPRQPANQPKTSKTLQVRYIFNTHCQPTTTSPSHHYRHRCHHRASRRSSVSSSAVDGQSCQSCQSCQSYYTQLAPAHLLNPGGQVIDSFTNINFQDTQTPIP